MCRGGLAKCALQISKTCDLLSAFTLPDLLVLLLRALLSSGLYYCPDFWPSAQHGCLTVHHLLHAQVRNPIPHPALDASSVYTKPRADAQYAASCTPCIQSLERYGLLHAEQRISLMFHCQAGSRHHRWYNILRVSHAQCIPNL